MARKCKVCKLAYTPFSSTTKVCSAPCAIALVKKEKQEKDDRKHRDKKKTFMLNDTTHQHKLTQTVFNKLRVMEEKKWFKDRGLNPSCISCGKENMDWCCGHFKTRGSQGNLRYDRKNTFIQCNRFCNMALSGNIEGNKATIGYKKGLAKRFGEEEAASIITYCETNKETRKWSGDELLGMREVFNKQIRALTSEE